MLIHPILIAKSFFKDHRLRRPGMGLIIYRSWFRVLWHQYMHSEALSMNGSLRHTLEVGQQLA